MGVDSSGAVGTVPVGTVPVGTVPVGTVPVGTVPVGTVVPVGPGVVWVVIVVPSVVVVACFCMHIGKSDCLLSLCFVLSKL